MTFIDAVNRVLDANGVLAGDTEEITTFADLQHKGTSRIARQAIQNELSSLIADSVLPYERDLTGSITTAAGTRTYSLATNFVRFLGIPSLYDSTSNVLLFEYPGGEDSLRQAHPDYQTAQSTPLYWYFERTTTKKIAFWYVPNAVKTYTYPFEVSVYVSSATDTMPFHNDMESHTFCRMASQRYKFMIEGKDISALIADPEHMAAKAVLADLVIGKNPSRSWAPVYR
jgi:hypothetical protein